ncbi:MAG: hypothetical protein ACI8WB_005198 [Phenylobacterium sp.]|jgi:hypothetical protein
MKENFKLIKQIYQQVKKSITVPEGAKIIVRYEGDSIIISFSSMLAPGVRGPEHAAEITVDSESGNVVYVN